MSTSFPMRKKRYEKVRGLDAEDDADDQREDIQLATLTRKQLIAGAQADDDEELKLDEEDDGEDEQDAVSLTPRSLHHRYELITAACNQLLRHQRLPVILKRIESVVRGYRTKRNRRMRPFAISSLAMLSATVLDADAGVSLLDYCVRQVYTLDLPHDPFAQSSTAPSLLSSLSLVAAAAAAPLPPLTSPPHPLQASTSSLLEAAQAWLADGEATACDVAGVDLLRVMRDFIADWQYSERKLGLKEAGEDEEEEADSLQGWLQADEEAPLPEEDDAETMSMRDFLGADAAAAEEEQEEDEDEDEKAADHRISIRAAPVGQWQAPGGSLALADLRASERQSSGGSEQELDDIQLESLDVADEGDDEDEEEETGVGSGQRVPAAPQRKPPTR